jgi:hypothetical protein
MIHPIHTSGPPAGHRPARTVAWLAGAVLLFGGVAQAERLDRDPVEQFRQALILETDKGIGYTNQLKGESLQKALEFRKENLNKAAAKIVSLSDLSRALLLVDWPPLDPDLGSDVPDDKKAESFEAGSRRIVTALRSKMASRFNNGIRAVLQNPRSSHAAKLAVANLIGETIVKASDQGGGQADDKRAGGKIDVAPGKPRLVADIDTRGFADELARATKDPNERVDMAIAGALGQFREQPRIVGPALKRLLAKSRPEATRLAAADALVNLSSSISNRVSLKGSEPGVTPAEPRRFRRDLEPEDILDLVKQVTDAASLGLSDPSVRVRQQCIAAMRNVAGEIPSAIRVPFSERQPPPRERTLRSAEEIEAIRAERIALDKSLRPVVTVLEDYSENYGDVLGRAVRDPDVTVRIDARKTLRELARARQALRDTRSALPEETPKAKEANPKPKIEDDLSRLPPPKSDAIRLVGGTDADAPAIPVRRLRQAPAGKADGITELLKKDDAALLVGARDSSARVRRAAHEAIEALGDDAARFLPELAKSLEDKDVFVRWIAARIMRKLAEEDDRKKRPHKSADVVVPALIKGLDDDDLDGRIAMVRALGAYGPDAKTAVPALTKFVGKGDAESRVAVLRALAGIGEDSRSALPELVAAFKATDPRVRGGAARLVGLLSQYAGAYVEDLEKLASDPDPKVREEAGAAILRFPSD